MPASASRISVRRAGVDDIPALVSLLEILFGIEEDFAFDPARQEQGLRLMLANNRGRVLVAEEGGMIIGMCTGQLLISTAEGGPAALVEDLVIGEDYRGHGAGRLLMDAIACWARAHGATRLHLLADSTNTPALDFYRKTGWRFTSLICLRKMNAGTDYAESK